MVGGFRRPTESLDDGVDLDAVSFRCARKRSDSDSRDAFILSARLGEDVCGVKPALSSLPIRLPGLRNVKDLARNPLLSVDLGLPTSDGRGKVRWMPLSVFGENRKVLAEDELERSEKFRSPDELGVKLREGVWIRELREDRERLTEDDDRVLLNGLERIVGADCLWLNEELGLLEPIDGLDLLEPTDELRILVRRSAIRPRPPARPRLEERVVLRLEILDLSRASAELPTIGEINTAAVTAAVAARVLISFLMFIFILLWTPKGESPLPPRSPAHDAAVQEWHTLATARTRTPPRLKTESTPI